jgi:hypothetical protein
MDKDKVRGPTARRIPEPERLVRGDNCTHTSMAVKAISTVLLELREAGWSRDDVELAGVQSLIEHRILRVAGKKSPTLADLQVTETLLDQVLRDEVTTLSLALYSDQLPEPAKSASVTHLKIVSDNSNPRVRRKRL